MDTYTARVIGTIPNPPRDGQSVSSSARVGVFRVEGDQETQVGKYVRNLSAFHHTFCAFRQGDQDYALYSPHYTTTRVMELPSCKDLGGEEADAFGFCPLSYYVPSYVDREKVSWNGRITHRRIHEPTAEDLRPRIETEYRRNETTDQYEPVEAHSRAITPRLYYPFGFVAGCMWGETTDKIQYLDLSQVAQGIIRREARFGYIVLPQKMALKDAIDLSEYEPHIADPDPRILITVTKAFDAVTGADLDK